MVGKERAIIFDEVLRMDVLSTLVEFRYSIKAIEGTVTAEKKKKKVRLTRSELSEEFAR